MAHLGNISQYLNEILQYIAISFSLAIPTNHVWDRVGLFWIFLSHYNLSVIYISQLGSRRYPISEIQVARLGFEPQTSCSISKELTSHPQLPSCERLKLHIWYTYSTNAALSNDTEVDGFHTKNSFLAHLSRRLKRAIVIAHRPSIRPSSVNFHIFDFFSRTTWWILMRLGRDQVLMPSWSLTSVVVFRPDPPRGGSRAGQK